MWCVTMVAAQARSIARIVMKVFILERQPHLPHFIVRMRVDSLHYVYSNLIASKMWILSEDIEQTCFPSCLTSGFCCVTAGMP